MTNPYTITKGQLIDRGWTAGFIDKFEPERIDSSKCRHVYSLDDVLKIEGTEAFKKALGHLDKSRNARRLRKQAEELAKIKMWIIDWLPLELELNIFCSDVVDITFVRQRVSIEEYRLHGSKLVTDRVFEAFCKRVRVKPELASDSLDYLHDKLGHVCSSLHKQFLREQLRKV